MSDTQQIPDETKLRNLLRAGEDCVGIVQGLIDKNKLPYIILKEEEDWSDCHNQRLVNGVCPVCGSGSNTVKRTIYNLRSTYTQGELFLQKFITVDPSMLRMKEDAIKMAKTPYEVLITGETGTGKESIAKSQIGSRVRES
jgi:transcriptional regulator with PAS, ATPase and Fis domain